MCGDRKERSLREVGTAPDAAEHRGGENVTVAAEVRL
jgi:hypothetical protein